MTRASDRFHRDVRIAGEKAVISVECVESSRGQPTEILGRLIAHDGSRDSVVFRLDVDGKHGQRPSVGQMFYAELDRLAVEVHVAGLEIDDSRPGRGSRIESIDLEIRAYAR
jgi:hypothetical protein